jgi:hypothetical protein
LLFGVVFGGAACRALLAGLAAALGGVEAGRAATGTCSGREEGGGTAGAGAMERWRDAVNMFSDTGASATMWCLGREPGSVGQHSQGNLLLLLQALLKHHSGQAVQANPKSSRLQHYKDSPPQTRDPVRCMVHGAHPQMRSQIRRR